VIIITKLDAVKDVLLILVILALKIKTHILHAILLVETVLRVEMNNAIMGTKQVVYTCKNKIGVASVCTEACGDGIRTVN
jgi:hypothetical protein